MKAVIMAGGMGTRLKAVTGDVPKPMAPLLGRPMMEHIVRLLRRQGFQDICVTVRYRAGDILAYFGDGTRFGVHMEYRVEQEALGTAGGVKNCEDFYGDDDFLVISGDAACDYELGRLMAEHKNRDADVSLALCRNGEPLRYGLALTDSQGWVRQFIEKPDWPQVVTDLVNTGIYVLSPRAMSIVPKGQACDFGRELFPALLQRGGKLLGVPLEGYWCDVGEPLAYYRCCADALEGRLKLELPPGFTRSAETPQDTEKERDCETLDCPCRSRAELMGALSELFMEMDADYGDGIRLSGRRYKLHISPLNCRSAIRIAVASKDTEFARELAMTAKKIADALDL